jgi:deoxycytidylate deaminase
VDFKGKNPMKSMDLSGIYKLRTDFTIIGITGRTGTGCTEVAEKLSKGFNKGSEYPNPKKYEHAHDAYKKYKIVYRFAKENFTPFILIRYTDVLMLEIIREGLDPFVEFLQLDNLKREFRKSGLNTTNDYSSEIQDLNKLRNKFEVLRNIIKDIDLSEIKHGDNLKKLHSLFFENMDFKELVSQINRIMQKQSVVKRNKALQVVAENLRKSGMPFISERTDPENIFTIVKILNSIIKAERKARESISTQIVIDSLRNPFEIMYFKQRYSAYYTFATNMLEEEREQEIKVRYHKKDLDDINQLLEEEYEGGKPKNFEKQNVKTCIQYSDIHITFRTQRQVKKLNKDLYRINPLTSPYFSWEMQLLKYVALIHQPGIVTPSPEERCMQLAYTAKYNSGCISRQVGAAITDESYSIKAIGWNNTPEGQAPCIVRNVEDLMDAKGDHATYSPFEREVDFRNIVTDYYKDAIENNRDKLKGRNVCFCFKSIRNSVAEGKNQVHTRSLHAEEGAFLQISKYGGAGIKNGKLFATASPCELCSKKAYQLGIKVIYYIDPYPGIAKKNVLDAGKKPPEVRAFDGAIGSAYHWLYEPIMSYKDELSLLLGISIPDLTEKQNVIIRDQSKVISSLMRQLNRKRIIKDRFIKGTQKKIKTLT